tara:strand:+ start:294 stop:800 length:507 start_codon:yes stop_codon:yes gene_type:complete
MSRKGPAYSATIFPEKTRRKGLDGKIWEIKKYGKSTKWVKTDETKEVKPPSKNLRLQGSCKKDGIKFKTFDIIKSVILNKTCYVNRLDIHSKNKSHNGFMYHSYENKTFNGRWYSNIEDTNKLDGKKYILTHNMPIYEDWNSGKIIKNVKIKIYFTEKGWGKFVKYFI